MTIHFGCYTGGRDSRFELLVTGGSMHHATAGSLLGIPGVAWFWALTVL